MIEVSDNARKLFKALPAEGKVGGITIREKVGLSMGEFRIAKVELKNAGLIELGKGRGGSLGRVEGAELPPEPKKADPVKRMAHAREAKQELSRAQRERDELREAAIKWGWKNYPEADDIQAGFYDGSWYVEVWKGRVAKNVFIEMEQLIHV